MSSNMKDARWYLAQELVETAGLAWEEFGYDEHEKLLQAAQIILDRTSEAGIAFLAERWRSDV